MASLHYQKDGERRLAAEGTVELLRKMAAGNAHWEIEDSGRVVERDGVRLYYVPDGNMDGLKARVDKLSARLDKINRGEFQGLYDYPSQPEAEAVFGPLQWVFDRAKRHTGLRSHFNHAERWLGQVNGWTIAIVPYVAGPVACYSSEVTC